MGELVFGVLSSLPFEWVEGCSAGCHSALATGSHMDTLSPKTMAHLIIEAVVLVFYTVPPDSHIEKLTPSAGDATNTALGLSASCFFKRRLI